MTTTNMNMTELTEPNVMAEIANATQPPPNPPLAPSLRLDGPVVWT